METCFGWEVRVRLERDFENHCCLYSICPRQTKEILSPSFLVFSQETEQKLNIFVCFLCLGCYIFRSLGYSLVPTFPPLLPTQHSEKVKFRIDPVFHINNLLTSSMIYDDKLFLMLSLTP